MAKWKETTKGAKSSTESIISLRDTIERNSDGSIKSIESHLAKRRIFEDGAEILENIGSVFINVSELSQPDLAFAGNVYAAIEKLIGDRLPTGE